MNHDGTPYRTGTLYPNRIRCTTTIMVWAGNITTAGTDGAALVAGEYSRRIRGTPMRLGRCHASGSGAEEPYTKSLRYEPLTQP